MSTTSATCAVLYSVLHVAQPPLPRHCEEATTHSRHERKVGTPPQGKRVQTVQQKGKRKPEALPRKCEREVDALPQGSSNKVKRSPAWSGLRYIGDGLMSTWCEVVSTST